MKLSIFRTIASHYVWLDKKYITKHYALELTTFSKSTSNLVVDLSVTHI
jgi:hypothetical protein